MEEAKCLLPVQGWGQRHQQGKVWVGKRALGLGQAGMKPHLQDVIHKLVWLLPEATSGTLEKAAAVIRKPAQLFAMVRHMCVPLSACPPFSPSFLKTVQNLSRTMGEEMLGLGLPHANEST